MFEFVPENEKSFLDTALKHHSSAQAAIQVRTPAFSSRYLEG